MSGNIEGGRKAAATNKKKYGKDFYAKIGARGGANGHTGGFADGEAGRERARVYGAVGGRKSKRTKTPKVASTDFSPTPAQSHSWFNTLRRK